MGNTNAAMVEALHANNLKHDVDGSLRLNVK
jgi:hypothetical protein